LELSGIFDGFNHDVEKICLLPKPPNNQADNARHHADNQHKSAGKRNQIGGMQACWVHV